MFSVMNQSHKQVSVEHNIKHPEAVNLQAFYFLVIANTLWHYTDFGE